MNKKTAKINVAVGVIDCNSNKIISVSRTDNVTYKDAVNFINRYYPVKLLQSNMDEAKVRVNLGYENEIEFNDISNWFTLNDLKDSDLITFN